MWGGVCVFISCGCRWWWGGGLLSYVSMFHSNFAAGPPSNPFHIRHLAGRSIAGAPAAKLYAPYFTLQVRRQQESCRERTAELEDLRWVGLGLAARLQYYSSCLACALASSN